MLFHANFWTKCVPCIEIYCIRNVWKVNSWKIKQLSNNATVAKSATSSWSIWILKQRFWFRRSKFSLFHSFIQYKCLNETLNRTNLLHIHEANCLLLTQGDAYKSCCVILLFQIASLLTQFHRIFVNIILIYRPEENIANVYSCYHFISNEETGTHLGFFHATYFHLGRNLRPEGYGDLT